MTVNELKTNDLEKIVGGGEPPKYLSPEAEIKAKEFAKLTSSVVHSWHYIETSPGSGLYRMRTPNDGKPNTAAGN